jgi:hypothetical protein
VYLRRKGAGREIDNAPPVPRLRLSGVILVLFVLYPYGVHRDFTVADWIQGVQSCVGQAEISSVLFFVRTAASVAGFTVICCGLSKDNAQAFI